MKAGCTLSKATDYCNITVAAGRNVLPLPNIVFVCSASTVHVFIITVSCVLQCVGFEVFAWVKIHIVISIVRGLFRK